MFMECWKRHLNYLKGEYKVKKKLRLVLPMLLFLLIAIVLTGCGTKVVEIKDDFEINPIQTSRNTYYYRVECIDPTTSELLRFTDDHVYYSLSDTEKPFITRKTVHRIGTYDEFSIYLPRKMAFNPILGVKMHDGELEYFTVDQNASK